MKRTIFNLLFALVLALSFSLLTATPALAANRTFTGPGTFSTAANWDGGTLPVAGDNLTINGTCTFDDTRGLTYGTLIVGGTSAGTLNWPAGSTNVLTVASVSSSVAGSGIDMTNGGTLQVSSTWTITNLTLTSGTGTVEFNGGAQTLPAIATFNNLTLSGSSTKTLRTSTTTISGNLTLSGTASATTVAALSISGNLSVGSGTSFTFAGFTTTVTGTTTVAGILIHSNTTGTKTFAGDVTVSSGGLWNETANAVISFGASLQNDGTFIARTAAHTFTGAAKTFSGTNAISIPNVTVSGTYTNNGTLTVSTALLGAGTLTARHERYT